MLLVLFEDATDTDSENDSAHNSFTVDWRLTGFRCGSNNSFRLEPLITSWGLTKLMTDLEEVTSATDYSRRRFLSVILRSTSLIFSCIIPTFLSILKRMSFLSKVIFASNYYVIYATFFSISSSNSINLSSVANLSISAAFIRSSNPMIYLSSNDSTLSSSASFFAFLEYKAKSSLLAPILCKILFCAFTNFFSFLFISESDEEKSEEEKSTASRSSLTSLYCFFFFFCRVSSFLTN